MQFQVVNILDVRRQMPDEALARLLDTFACEKNRGIEHFLKCHSVSSASQRFAITYLVINILGELVGFFTLAHKPTYFVRQNLTGKWLRRVKQFCILSPKGEASEDETPLLTSAFLIAQFAKNTSTLAGIKLSGNELMDFTMQVLEDIQKCIGGGVIYLECEDQQKLLDFYMRQGFANLESAGQMARGNFIINCSRCSERIALSIGEAVVEGCLIFVAWLCSAIFQLSVGEAKQNLRAAGSESLRRLLRRREDARRKTLIFVSYSQKIS